METTQLTLMQYLLEQNPNKNNILKYLDQQEMYGPSIYLDITKEVFLKAGILYYFPLIAKQEEAE